MAYNTISDLFKGICDALRNKTGSSGLINHQDIPDKINEITISNGGIDTSDATATEEDLLENKSAYVKGKKITGSIPLWNGIEWKTPVASWDSTNKRLRLKSSINARIFLEKDTSGTMYCAGDTLGDAKIEDVRSGAKFTSSEGLSLTGTWVPTSSDGNGIDTTITTNGAESDDIVSGKKAWVNSSLVTGNMAQIPNGTSFDNCEASIKTGNLYLDSPNFIDRQWIETGSHISLSTPASNLGNADPSKVLQGTTFTSANGIKQTGTYIPSGNTEIDSNLVEENIKAGVSINGVTGTFTNDATATVEDIAKDITAYVNGEKITGVLERKNNIVCGAISSNVSSSGSTIKCSGTYTGSAIIKDTTVDVNVYPYNFGDATPEDVVAGKTFTSSSGLKVIGTHTCETGLDTSDATATASDIANGKTAYVNGTKVTGNVATIESNYTQSVNSINNTVSQGSSGTSGSTANYICNKHTFTSNNLFRKGSSINVGVEISNYGDASPEDVIKGRFFTSASGLNVEGSLVLNGEHVWQKYNVEQNWTYTSELLGTEKPSDATGTSRQSYTITSDGRFELSETESTLGGYYASASNSEKVIYYSKWVFVYSGDSYYEYYKYTITNSSENNKANIIGCITSNNATAYPDNGVQDGYWYVKLNSGEDPESGSSEDSLITKKGTTTSATINTGLSEVKAFFIDCAANSGAGLCTLSYSSDLDYMTVYGRSSYTQAITRVATSGNSYVSFSGGTVSLKGTGNYAFRSNMTYSWVAIGTE